MSRRSIDAASGRAALLDKPDRRRGSRPATDQEIGDIAGIFDLLGDPGRLRLLTTLLAVHEMRVSDLAHEVGMSESAVSHALSLLRAHKVVAVRRAGRHAHYSLLDDHVRILLKTALDHIRHDG
jgi:DNA-binding transcriptional ArsR family regulator